MVFKFTKIISYFPFTFYFQTPAYPSSLWQSTPPPPPSPPSKLIMINLDQNLTKQPTPPPSSTSSSSSDVEYFNQTINFFLILKLLMRLVILFLFGIYISKNKKK